MVTEKSCGAVIYRKQDKDIEFLAIKSKAFGNWGFPKGHMEEGEVEEETAKREVFEETGLSIILLDDFRIKVEYPLSGGVSKEVVYFIGEALDQSIKIQKEEVQEFKWLDYDDMLELLTFENTKHVLFEARTFLNNMINMDILI